MACRIVPTTIKVWESKPISCNYICFDAALLVILPSLAAVSYVQSDALAFSIFCFIISVHIAIGFYRYHLRKEIQWHLCEIVAISMGTGLCVAAFTHTGQIWYTVLLAAVGIFIVVGHVGGLCCPNRPLYWDCRTETKNYQTINMEV